MAVRTIPVEAKLPAPSSELILFAVAMESFLSVLSRKDRARFLNRVERALQLENAGFPRFRSPSEDQEVHTRLIEARVWFDKIRPTLERMSELMSGDG